MERKVMYHVDTNAILGVCESNPSPSGPGYADLPEGFLDDQACLWKYDPASSQVVKKTGQEYQDAYDQMYKPGKKAELKKRYGAELPGLLLEVIDLLDKVVNGQSLNNNEKKEWKDTFADAAKKAKQDMKADPEWPGA